MEPEPDLMLDEPSEDEGDVTYECPECGSPVASSAIECETCGVRFASAEDDRIEEEEVSIAVGKEYPPPVVSEEEMPPAYEAEPAGKDDLFARGDEAPEKEAKVDLDFGEDLEAEFVGDEDEDYLYECPECGGEVKEDALICPNCGAEFEE